MLRIKVLHFITGLGFGGAENMLLKILPKLSGEHIVVSLTSTKGMDEKLRDAGIAVLYINYNPFRFRKIIKEFTPDILNSYLIHANLYGRVFGRLFGVKYIISSIRNKLLNKGFLVFLDNITSFMTDLYTPNSEAVGKYVHKVHKIPKEKIVVIPNSIDVSEFDRVVEKKKGKVLCCVGSFKKQKGHEYLLKAMQSLDCELWLVGGGALEEEMKLLAKTLDVDNKVVFLGVRHDVKQLLKQSDIFILPSLHEGMSNALLEAMAAKCPIVASDIEENLELIEGVGLPFKVKDSTDMAENINKLLNDAALREDLAEKAYARVKEKYNLKVTIDKLEEVYANAQIYHTDQVQD